MDIAIGLAMDVLVLQCIYSAIPSCLLLLFTVFFGGAIKEA